MRETEEDHRAVFELAGVGIAQADPVTGRLLRVNAKMCQITGYSEEELLGRTFAEITHPDDREEDFERFRQMVRGETHEHVIEKRYVRKDGTVAWMSVNARVIRDADGEPSRTVATIQDITEHKEAEERLRKSEGLARRRLAELQTVYDSAPVGLGFVNRELRFVNVNETLAEFNGLPADEHIGRTLREVLPPKLADRLEPIYRGVIETGKPVEGLELQAETSARPGEVRDWVLNYYPVEDDEGEVLGVSALVQEITERKKSEKELRHSEEQFRLLVEGVKDYSIFMLDPEGYVSSWNRGARRIEGYAADEILGQHFSVFYPEDDVERGKPGRVLETARTQGTCEGEGLRVRKDGSWFWASVLITALHDEEGNLRGFAKVVRDVTERKRAEEVLKASLKELEDLKFALDESDIVAFTDQRGRITYVNEKFCEISGYSREELIGRDHRLINSGYHPKEYIRNLWRTIAQGRVWQGELKNRAKGGSYYWVDTTIVPFLNERGKPYQYVAIRHDVTDRKRAEEELRSRTRQQSAVADLGLRALAESDLQAILDESVALVARTLGVEYCKVLQLLPSGDELLLRAGVGWKEGLVGSARVGTGLDSQAGYTLLSGEPVIVDDLRKEERFGGPPLLHEHGVVSGTSVIIRGADKPYGVLGAHTKELRTFTKDDASFVQAVANVLATAVAREESREQLRYIQEAERRRMARDMHDDVLQDLTHALQKIRGGQEDEYGDGQRDTDLEESAGALRRSIEGLRAAIFDLRLEGDREQTLVELLESLVEMNRRSSPGLDIGFSVEEGFQSLLAGAMEVEFLRIVREALNNSRRHSGARCVQVAVGAAGGRLWVEVSDDGRGFDPEEAPAGMGLRGMRERARALGGSLTVRSKPGEGTSVRFEVAPKSEAEEPEETRILIVEDHASFRQGVASALEEAPRLSLVGQAGSLSEAREMLGASQQVDVAIVDLGLPDGFGGDLIKDLRALNPRSQALVVSSSLDRAEAARAVEAGAAGILHKSVDMDEILEAVRRLGAGETLLPLEEVIELLRFAGSHREEEYQARQAIAQLTPREKEVLEALAEGLDGEEIAQRLHISLKTERNHMSSILTKLGAKSRLQALVFAARHGLVEVGQQADAGG